MNETRHENVSYEPAPGDCEDDGDNDDSDNCEDDDAYDEYHENVSLRASARVAVTPQINSIARNEKPIRKPPKSQRWGSRDPPG